jgi:glycosyltransferase involved in cell wall biosynthesis
MTRERVVWAVRRPVRRTRNAVAAARATARQWRRWRAIASAQPRRGEPAVSYGLEAMPGPSDVVIGGAVKFQLLDHFLPNAPRDFNVLYLGSSALTVDAPMLVRLARRRGAAFVWNQNGVAYHGWYGNGWELVNAPRARLLHEADHVVYQSAFCKVAADTFYGPRAAAAWEILHNPVDTRAFTPAAVPSRRPLTLLLGGSQYQRYRVERALDTLAAVRLERPDARLLIAGAISFTPDGRTEVDELVTARGLGDAVELTGSYTQADAPALFHRADVLVHTKYNDPCPTVVLEAMSCGLPVAYSASGGTPELVGEDAGAGVPAPLDWERDHPPAADELAGAVLALAADLPARSAAAREQALRFDARAWAERHRALFEELVS